MLRYCSDFLYTMKITISTLSSTYPGWRESLVCFRYVVSDPKILTLVFPPLPGWVRTLSSVIGIFQFRSLLKEGAMLQLWPCVVLCLAKLNSAWVAAAPFSAACLIHAFLCTTRTVDFCKWLVLIWQTWSAGISHQSQSVGRPQQIQEEA